MITKQINKIAKKAVNSYINTKTDPNIVISSELAKVGNVNSHFVNRVVEKTNVELAKKYALKNPTDKGINFPVADANKIKENIGVRDDVRSENKLQPLKIPKIGSIDYNSFTEMDKEASVDVDPDVIKRKNYFVNLYNLGDDPDILHEKSASRDDLNYALDDYLNEKDNLKTAIKELTHRYKKDINKVAHYVINNYSDEDIKIFIKCAVASGITLDDIDDSVSPYMPKEYIPEFFKKAMDILHEKRITAKKIAAKLECPPPGSRNVRDLKPGQKTHIHLQGRYKGLRVVRDENSMFYVTDDVHRSKSYPRPSMIPDTVIRKLQGKKARS